jgi:hypothetical protein
MCILVNCIIHEELIELLILLERKNIKTKNIIIYIPDYLDISDEYKYKKVIKYKSNKNRKTIYKMLELIKFIFIFIKFRPNHIYTGFSMMKHRIVSLVFRTEHTAYIRGLMFDPKVKTGFGDYLKYGKLGFLFKSYIFNTYEASEIITISRINKNFLIDRNIDSKKITLIKPIWLEKYNIYSTSRKEIKTIVFLTQAFESHSLVHAHKSQVDFFKKLIVFSKLNKYNLILRQHPRDYFNYKKNVLGNFEINNNKPEVFLKSLDKSFYIISPLSTFAFEAIYIGLNVSFYSTKVLDRLYLNKYNELGIIPMYKPIIKIENNLNNVFFK